jgi:transposase
LLPPDSYLFGIFREIATIMYRPVHVVRTWIMNIEETGSALEI